MLLLCNNTAYIIQRAYKFFDNFRLTVENSYLKFVQTTEFLNRYFCHLMQKVYCNRQHNLCCLQNVTILSLAPSWQYIFSKIGGIFQRWIILSKLLSNAYLCHETNSKRGCSCNSCIPLVHIVAKSQDKLRKTLDVIDSHDKNLIMRMRINYNTIKTWSEGNCTWRTCWSFLLSLNSWDAFTTLSSSWKMRNTAN